MSHNVGIWIDHTKAVIVSLEGDQVSAKTLESAVGSHPRYSGPADREGEKNYEARQAQHLLKYYDDVLAQMGQPASLLIFGPAEAKVELKQRVSRIKALSACIVDVQTTDKLSDAQIVAKVKAHFDAQPAARG